MRSHVATWTVIVTVDRPAPEGPLGLQINQLKGMIAPLKDQTGYDATTEIWEERIKEIEETLIIGQTTVKSRHR